eukprot:TRINITY_DN11856_c0_g1_i1.p1 TRINITY_DN11856_c0_g1~~TRINITY_DN11856_c0_g1_i1.p1  ORF type:complete len:263 (+),score=52.29 TRINITY_DN11856_c0_g1_i1:89-790(+)
MLTAFVAQGDEQGVRRVLESDPGAVNELGLDGTSPLCAAALWGHEGTLRLLLEAMASPCIRNENGPRWTPLHAAALQEHGKACMLLLDFRANPMELDAESVTACDYAACSEAVWPIFAARGCERLSKAELVSRGVLRKASPKLESELLSESASGEASRRGVVTEYSRPGSAYVVVKEFPPRPGSVAGGRPGGMSSSRRGLATAASRPIDILEEEEGGDKEQEKLGASLRSLGI